jgi:hypothetical protein
MATRTPIDLAPLRERHRGVVLGLGDPPGTEHASGRPG